MSGDKTIRMSNDGSLVSDAAKVSDKVEENMAPPTSKFESEIIPEESSFIP